MFSFQRPKHRRAVRRGAAAVELAVWSPLLVLLPLASIELAGKIFLQETLYIAAYEGALTAARKSGTSSLVSSRVSSILSGRGVDGFSVVTNPADVTSANKGDPVQVIVSAPIATNSLLPAQLFPQTSLTAQITVMKEDK